MTSQQTKAQRLAGKTAGLIHTLRRTPMPLSDLIPHLNDSADELRRLHAENERLKTVPMKYRRMAFNAELQEENADLRERADHYQSERDALRTATERLTAINAQLLEFVQSLIDDYHSDEGFPEARYVVHAARAAIAAAKEQA